MEIENWKSQIRKGYLDLCILLLIESKKGVYGLELLEVVKKVDVRVKEGTLYRLLSRRSVDGLLSSEWETKNSSGHPRKFYPLTKVGKGAVSEMQIEFDKLINVYSEIKKLEE